MPCAPAPPAFPSTAFSLGIAAPLFAAAFQPSHLAETFSSKMPSSFSESAPVATTAALMRSGSINKTLIQHSDRLHHGPALSIASPAALQHLGGGQQQQLASPSSPTSVASWAGKQSAPAFPLSRTASDATTTTISSLAPSTPTLGSTAVAASADTLTDGGSSGRFRSASTNSSVGAFALAWRADAYPTASPTAYAYHLAPLQKSASAAAGLMHQHQHQPQMQSQTQTREPWHFEEVPFFRAAAPPSPTIRASNHHYHHQHGAGSYSLAHAHAHGPAHAAPVSRSSEGSGAVPDAQQQLPNRKPKRRAASLPGASGRSGGKLGVFPDHADFHLFFGRID